MQLYRFEIRNYKCIEYVSLKWDDLLVLIGENNAGKSSVLSAIAAFLSGSSIKDASLFRRHQTDDANAIELIGHFYNLSDEEKNQVAVRSRMDGDSWVLKKRYWFEPGEDGELGSWKEQLHSFSGIEQFLGWPDPDTTWAAFPADYQPIIDSLPNKGARPNVGSRESLKAAVREQRPDLVAVGAAGWVPNPGGGGNWKSNANSILPRPILVKAVQEASDETNAKDASTYGKLVNLIVERSLAQRPEMAALQVALDDVLALFRPDPANPQRQAQEVRDLQDRINQSLNEVVGGQPSTQVACCTHSPVFLDIANRYRAIVRMFKTPQGNAACYQVSQDLFPVPAHQADKQRLQTVARFHPTVNELFFAKSVVLLEEGSAIAAFERGADLMGLFQRHPRLRREVTLVDCNGKKNIPPFQRVLNAFQIPYRVVHDADTNNPAAFADNAPIAAALPAGGAHLIHQVLPNDLEGLLGYVAAKGSSKPYIAVCTVENLHAQGQLPAAFQEAVCIAYFGQIAEPQSLP